VLIIVQCDGTKIDIDKLEVNETVTLKNIFFEGNLPDILQSSMPELQNLFNFMNEHKKVTIQIEGHACCKGMETGKDIAISDEKLSEMRAKAIYDYLGAKGINKKRMKYVGYGTARPLVYPANTEDEQQQNRRVEIRILSK
jgi:outer membrane protein OmpA-like peptidoglycan-associated protein